MTDESPKKVVHSYYEYADADRHVDLVSLCAEDIHYERPGQHVIDGSDSLRSFFSEGQAIEDGSHELHDVVADGQTVAVRGDFSGSQEGHDVEIGFASFFRVNDGKIARIYAYTDRDNV